MFNGKIHSNWPFSIAMLNYQRVVGPKILPSWNTIRVNVLSFNFCWPPKKKELDQTKKKYKKKTRDSGNGYLSRPALAPPLNNPQQRGVVWVKSQVDQRLANHL